MTFPGKPFAPFTWSYSKLRNFETCPKRSFHYDITRDIREPESPQLRAGNELHAAFDQKISLGTPLPFGMSQHEKMLESIVGAPGTTHSEQKLALTSSFQPAGYYANNVWFRTVIDAAKIAEDRSFATAFDWKTGKPYADMTQMQLISATMFHYEPKLARVRAALVFVGHDIIEKAEFVREDLTEIWGEILPRVKKLEQAGQDMEYPPKPSGLCKKYCAVEHCKYYKKGG